MSRVDDLMGAAQHRPAPVSRKDLEVLAKAVHDEVLSQARLENSRLEARVASLEGELAKAMERQNDGGLLSDAEFQEAVLAKALEIVKALPVPNLTVEPKITVEVPRRKVHRSIVYDKNTGKPTDFIDEDL